MSDKIEPVVFEEGENVQVYITRYGFWLDGRVVRKTGIQWLVGLNSGEVYRFDPEYVRKLNRSAPAVFNVQNRVETGSDLDVKKMVRELVFRLAK